MSLLKFKSIKKNLEKNLKKTAIQGKNYIELELERKNQKASVSYSIEKDKIKFKISPKVEQTQIENLPKKEALKLKKVLGDIPIEMFNQEIAEENFSISPIDDAMEKTQDSLIENINGSIKKIL